MPEDRIPNPAFLRDRVAAQPYPCYPGLKRFAKEFDAGVYENVLRNRAGADASLPFSVYIGWPKRLHPTAARRYRECLDRELEIVSLYLPLDSELARPYCRAEVWNGEELIGLMHRAFSPYVEGDYAIDISLRNAVADQLGRLSGAGFNHLRIDVRDSKDSVDRLYDGIGAAHRAGFEMVDVICDSRAAQALAASPGLIDLACADGHRVILFGSMNQRRSADLLEAAGYVHLGMNHFVQPDDDLVLARQRGRLNYDQQRGYFIGAHQDSLGFGLAGVSSLGRIYCQSHGSLAGYHAALARGRLPVRCGMILSADQLVRRSVMHALICHLAVSFEAINISFLVNFKQYFAAELSRLEEFAGADLIELTDEWITVTIKGKRVLPLICSVFDVSGSATGERQT